MADNPVPPNERRRWINIGEIVAVAGLVISGLALWNSWKGSDDKPAVKTVEQPRSVPLALRGTVEAEGRALALAPAEASHTLETLTLTAQSPASGTAPFGSDPRLSASLIESWLAKDTDNERPGSLVVAAEARYIERGESRVVRQRYRITYRWTEGGLFGGRSLRVTGISRS
jgi:hypothetical protein